MDSPRLQLELHRMFQLCQQEAAEYQRGKNLQLVQPQHHLLTSFSASSSAQALPLLLGRPGTFSFPLAAVSSALGTPIGMLDAVTSVGAAHHGAADDVELVHHLSAAAGQPHAALPATTGPSSAAATAAAADAAGHPAVSLGTPLAITPQPALLQTPSTSSMLVQPATDSVAAGPPAQSPAVLAGGVSSQQMALACNSMVRLPLQHVKQEVSAMTPLQLQFQLPLPTPGLDTATPMLRQQQQQQQQHNQQPMFTPLIQQLGSSAGPAALSLFHSGPAALHVEAAHGSSRHATAAGAAAADLAAVHNRKGKRQGYQIEPAALQRLIQKQMDAKTDSQQPLQTADNQEQQQQQLLMPQQHHRQRSLARIPPQLQQQHLQQKQQQAEQQKMKQAQLQPQQQQQEQGHQHPAARETAAAGAAGGWASPASSTGAGGPQLQLPAALDSPDACIGLQLPASLGSDLEQPVNLDDLDSSKMFGSAQKRLRLSLCDEPHNLVPPALQLAGLASPAAAQLTPAAAAAAAAGGVGGGAGPARDDTAGADAAGPGSALATPSKFFSGSPVPLAARQQAAHTPETPLLFGHAASDAATPPWPRKQLDVEQAGCCPLRSKQEAAAPPSGWVPITSALHGTTPASAAAAAATAVPAMAHAANCFSSTPAADADALLVPVDTGAAAVAAAIAAAAAMSAPPTATANAAAQLATPEVQEQLLLATPAAGVL